MSADVAQARPSILPAQIQKSRLLPYNRRLRHLHGITLRNLTLFALPQRARGKTIDDEALPYALKSPAKLLAASERNKLAHSRSFDNIKAEANLAEPDGHHGSEQEAIAPIPQTPTRPRKPRRSSTLDWANASPGQRQENRRDVISKRTAHVFFTLHCAGVKDPVYISEVVESASNPNFRFFDLNGSIPIITRQDTLSVNFWTRNIDSSQWRHLIELSVDLKYLQFIGRSLEDYYSPLPENCIIFHLHDGLYTSFDELPTKKHADTTLAIRDVKSPDKLEVTSSYDALMRLATLDECIQEAVATRNKLTSDINAMISQDKQRFYTSDAISTAQDSLENIQRAQESERRQIKSLNARLAELRHNLSLRRESIEKSASTQSTAVVHKEQRSIELDTLRASYDAIQTPIRGQRRRICTDLSTIYHIDPIPNKSLLFTICSLALPNSNFSKSDISNNADAISAALGHTAHLTHLLALYLSIALPYPIDPRSSSSTITDPISTSLAQLTSSTSTDPANRTFPLHLSRSAPFYRFEYGVFLLNKDIELLASKLGLRILDIRQTLPNLKYILFVVTAGDGDVPARKAGGVRALLSAGTRGEKDETTPDGSRPASLRGVGAPGQPRDIAATLRKRLVDGRSPPGELNNADAVRNGARLSSTVGKGRATVS